MFQTMRPPLLVASPVPVGLAAQDEVSMPPCFVFSCGTTLLYVGVPFSSVQFAPRMSGVGTVLSWNEIKPAALPAVSAKMIYEASRKWFSVDDFLRRVAIAIFRYDGSQLEAIAEMTSEALADTWPARIENSTEFVQFCKVRRHTVSALSLGGLLGLAIDALRYPWSSSPDEIQDQATADRRWARLVMLASTEPHIVVPHEIISSRSNDRIPYQTQRVLLGSARLGELDDVRAFMVRSFELYSEFLPSCNNKAVGTFGINAGRGVDAWISGIAEMVGALRTLAEQRSLSCPIIDLSQDGSAGGPLRELLWGLSLSPAGFQSALATQADGLLVLRKFPVLRQANDRYLVLHPGFLLAAADDGAWYRINDGLLGNDRSEFQTKFGQAVELYTKRVLQRCADQVHSSVVAKVDEGQGHRRPLRCDFAWKIGEDLVLFDSKRAGFSAKMLNGDDEIVRRLDTDLGKGCRQILGTIHDAKCQGWANVVPELKVVAGWQPRRIFAMLITHRPTYMWFSSTADLLKRTGIEQAWRIEFGSVRPVILALSELELFEAALPALDMSRFLSEIADNAPYTLGGLHMYLNGVSYRGPACSEYYQRRFTEILSSAE